MIKQLLQKAEANISSIENPFKEQFEYIMLAARDTSDNAGKEEAVAATKTYTAQLMAIAMLSISFKVDPNQLESLMAVPGWWNRFLIYIHNFPSCVNSFFSL